MTASSRIRLLFVGIGMLLFLGVLGAAVHDDPDERSRTAADSPDLGGWTFTSSTPSAPAATSTVPVPGPATTVIPAPTPSVGPSAEGSASGLGATGNGSVALGSEPLANTGSEPSTVPALVLLALAAGARTLSRRALA